MMELLKIDNEHVHAGVAHVFDAEYCHARAVYD